MKVCRKQIYLNIFIFGTLSEDGGTDYSEISPFRFSKGVMLGSCPRNCL